MTSEAASFLVSPERAAQFLGISRSYLAQMRVRGDGPRFTKLGRAVRYRLDSLRAWAEAREVTSTSQAAA
jgi:predicted DNA-binding transcriptional regulator AlpA